MGVLLALHFSMETTLRLNVPGIIFLMGGICLLVKSSGPWDNVLREIPKKVQSGATASHCDKTGEYSSIMVLINLHTCFMHQIEALDMLSMAKRFSDLLGPIVACSVPC